MPLSMKPKTDWPAPGIGQHLGWLHKGWQFSVSDLHQIGLHIYYITVVHMLDHAVNVLNRLMTCTETAPVNHICKDFGSIDSSFVSAQADFNVD